jgi:RNA methyltransferase, TrmH family
MKAPARKPMRIAGLPAVTALFAVAPQRVERLFFEAHMKPHVGAFCAELARRRRPYRQVGAQEMERVAGSVLHGGIVALAEPRPLPGLEAAELGQWARADGLLLLLDGVGNPHNLGAIARTAAFFGIKRIVLSDHPGQAGPSDASYRVAEGGLEHVELYRAPHFTRALTDVRRHYHLIGTAAEGGRSVAALPHDDRPIALVLGNEEQGLPRATLKACAAIVSIPGSGLVQSINVAASAAILLYALSEHARPIGGS